MLRFLDLTASARRRAGCAKFPNFVCSLPLLGNSTVWKMDSDIHNDRRADNKRLFVWRVGIASLERIFGNLRTARNGLW